MSVMAFDSDAGRMAERDAHWMAAALRRAARNTGRTGANPSVGCFIVASGADGRDAVVARAVTAVGGRPHAETEALDMAGERARGATVYVTLEPCSHHGKTPPCVNALIAAGVSRVVVSVTDPDPRVSGRGFALLRQAGIEVVTGVLEEEGERALDAYLRRQRQGRPLVTLKLAVSADGMIGRLGDGQVPITGPQARARVQTWRARSDAILIGAGTAVADDPLLTCRIPGMQHRSPHRIVLDKRLELPVASKLVATARDVPVMIVTGKRPSDAETDPRSADAVAALARDAARAMRRAALEAEGVEVVESDPDAPATLLTTLAARGIASLFIEGGARVAADFLAAGLVDRIALFTAPRVIGAGGIAAPVTRDHIPEGFALSASRMLGQDRLDLYERAL
ncbi:diaminohydroxyphosphoribosylaminopyrimidine deaminase [Rhizobium sp. RU20A]|uniref:bifunctional diaminohydroxyphosphoribosylaminopyrimidine deaminase/5-amino-6-(5-phosphoribosylamino)uracil reductase RibD n=1 Tax=Rhizobium sp. RU20A TaxID=1907412 RepID=UPI0009547A3F|nr:bifunctional diaminohydroxyphosphoribosylaminopyrimidine deaminase/5-amino-6-(5-phosphoribosylamino)uracil reductase RibD [Rhizobium sp. RU20A]SIP95214.1 diaminohydroxyphosphoribosylaminopyrimidine deaminase [Rhizobium sp. RU20A]